MYQRRCAGGRKAEYLKGRRGCTRHSEDLLALLQAVALGIILDIDDSKLKK